MFIKIKHTSLKEMFEKRKIQILVFDFFFFFFSIVAPIKALCSERYHDWNNKFSPLGLNCTELTGDTNIEDFQALQRSHIVFTTPVIENFPFLVFTKFL